MPFALAPQEPPLPLGVHHPPIGADPAWDPRAKKGSWNFPQEGGAGSKGTRWGEKFRLFREVIRNRNCRRELTCKEEVQEGKAFHLGV